MPININGNGAITGVASLAAPSGIDSGANNLILDADPTAAHVNTVIGLQIDGARVVTIDDSGNMGIGTASPSTSNLAIVNALNAVLTVGQNVDGTGVDHLGISYGSSAGSIFTSNGDLNIVVDGGSGSGSSINLINGSGDRVVFNSSGNVGIGTSAPGALLDVNNVGRFLSASPSYPSAGKGIEIYFDSAGDLGYLQAYDRGGSAWKGLTLAGDTVRFRTAGNEVGRFDASGRLGVGTTSPAEKLHVAGKLLLNNGSASYFDAAASNGLVITNPTAVRFEVNSGERVRIDSSGRVRTGGTTSTLSGNGWYLEENGQANYRAATTGNAYVFRSGTSTVGSISVTTTNTAYNTSSDYRLKENVNPVTDGITRLQQLKPSRFNFIANPDTTVDGFLAHEVQDIVPEAITGEKDAVDDEGNPQYQGIDQSKLVPLITAALQEAIVKIETLETQNADLAARITALETN